jgi:hypothetical protein
MAASAFDAVADMFWKKVPPDALAGRPSMLWV